VELEEAERERERDQAKQQSQFRTGTRVNESAPGFQGVGPHDGLEWAVDICNQAALSR
jgi:hypothetical protein